MTFFQSVLLFSGLNNTVKHGAKPFFLISIVIFVKNYTFCNKRHLTFFTRIMCTKHNKLHHKPFLFVLITNSYHLL